MSTLTLTPASVKATRLEIKNATYEARPIDPGFAGLAAVRVTKLVNRDSVYDVVLTHENRVTCDCPDYIARHEDKGTHCKHCKAVLAAGLLVAPVSGGSPAAEAPPAVVRPVTEADLKRAAYFHLTIPKPAPTAHSVHSVAPVLEAAPEIPAENPRDSWPAWTDADRWTTEAPALASDDQSACPPEGPRPTARHGHAPSAEDEAYASGFYLQFNHGLAVDPPSEWRLTRSSAFRLGQADGLLARFRREDEETAEWVAERERERSEPREADGHAPGYYS